MYAAIYCRKSVNTQKGESMQSQLEHCRAYLAAHRSAEEAQRAWVYRDEGFSGAALRRPAMQRLLKDIRGGRIHCVVCYRLDRISRSVSDFTALMEEFSRYRVSFLCAAEAFDTEKPMGRAMLYIASVFAQLERETIAERVRDNMYTLAADGRWLGGPPPYGYRILRTPPPHPHSQLVADDTAYSAVQTIFSAFLRRGEIDDALAAVSSPGQRGGRTFSRRFLRDLLQNPLYAAADVHTAAQLSAMGYAIAFSPAAHCTEGVSVYGRHPNRRRETSALLAAKGSHPAICSGRDWQSIRIALRGEHTEPKPPRLAVGLLRHMLRCGRCGDVMQCKRRSGREGQYDYICRRKARQNHCDCPNLTGNAADDAVWDAIARTCHLPQTALQSTIEVKAAVVELVVSDAVWNGDQLSLTLRR